KHTGTDITPVESITVTTTPVDDHKGLQDFIYWRPDAAGTGVEPVYVVISDPYGETNASSTDSAPEFPNHMTSDGHDNGAEKPSNIKVADDKYLKNNGVDAHQIKKDFLGSKAEIKLYDIYVDKDSGQLWIFIKGGKGEGIPTGEFINN
ncbi:polymorphic toxin type 33 domain-containing protein, partial [Pectobacterium odoriferum]